MFLFYNNLISKKNLNSLNSSKSSPKEVLLLRFFACSKALNIAGLASNNSGNPIIYSGSADVMIRSFRRRIESLFKINEESIKKQAITILNYNLRDNCNSYILKEDGTYTKKKSNGNSFDILL